MKRHLYTYDTEFLENGTSIELISIGVVDCEDPTRTYYAINRQAPWGRIERHTWLMENVVPSLEPMSVENVGSHDYPTWRFDHIEWAHPQMKLLGQIATDLEEFFGVGDAPLAEGTPELWAYYSAYDHVALCQLWGVMINLPKGMPMYTMDIKQEAHRQDELFAEDMASLDRIPGSSSNWPEQVGGHHNALDDALHNMVKMRTLGIIT